MSERRYHRHTPAEKLAKMEALIEEKFRTHKTWEQVCANHSIDRSTKLRWSQTEEWREIEQRYRRMLREELRTDVTQDGRAAVQVLRDLMHGVPGADGSKVGSFTRYSAAKTLIELVGLEQELEEKTADKVDEIVDFLKAVGREPELPRAAIAQHLSVEVLPGGHLPPEIVAENEIMYAQLRADEEAIEAEFKVYNDLSPTQDSSQVYEDVIDVDDEPDDEGDA